MIIDGFALAKPSEHRKLGLAAISYLINKKTNTKKKNDGRNSPVIFAFSVLFFVRLRRKEQKYPFVFSTL